MSLILEYIKIFYRANEDRSLNPIPHNSRKSFFHSKDNNELVSLELRVANYH